MFGSIWQIALRRLGRRSGRLGRTRPTAPYQPHLDTLENRVVPACTSTDPFICTPLSSEGTVVHIHPVLTIMVNGQKQEIPAGIGIQYGPAGNAINFLPLHTHDTSGHIHIESGIQRDFHLADFFAVWGQKFDPTHILGFQAPAGSITMTVGGTANGQFGNLLLYSQTSGVNLNEVQIVITATNAWHVALPPDFFAVGGSGHVQVRRTGTGALLSDFMPFGTSYTGGVSVAVGDVLHNGNVALVVSTTDGMAAVKVYNGQIFLGSTPGDPNNPGNLLLASFNAIDPNFHTGISVAVGDILGDGYADVVTGAVAGNPDVKVFKGIDIAHQYENIIAPGLNLGGFNPTGSSLVVEYFSYGLQFNIGTNIAVGDLSKNGFDDIVTGAVAGNPHVKVYSGKAIASNTLYPNPESHVIAQFFAYGLQFNIGATVAVGDINGDGTPDLITGSAAGNADIKVYNGAKIAAGTFNPNTDILNEFFAYGINFDIGARIAAADFENNGHFDILTGASAGNPHYRIVKGNSTGIVPPSVSGIEGIPSDIMGGIFVGA